MNYDLKELLKNEYYRKRYDQLEETSIDYISDEEDNV